MALHSYLLAMGNLSEANRSLLERPKRFYVDLPDGTFVFQKLFLCESTSASYRLAKAFRVNLRDPSTYAVNPKKVRRSILDDAMTKNSQFGFVQDWHMFEQLRDQGFLFFFRPEF